MPPDPPPPQCTDCGQPAIHERPRRTSRGRFLVPVCDEHWAAWDEYTREQREDWWQ